MIAGRLLRTRARRWVALALVVLVVAAVVAIAWPRSGPPPVVAQDEKIVVPGGPGVDGTVTLDAGLYLPAETPAPAVIVAHGFGGSRLSVDADAQRLARDGFVVLTYSARGFGESTGQIGLDSLDYEVPDARALVTWLSHRPEVVQDAPGDPRVGVTGGSYGGALALMLAGTDRRVDAVAAVATWNDLTQSLFPNDGAVTNPPAGAGPRAAGPTPADIPPGRDGVFKKAWAAALMTSVISGADLAGSAGGPLGGAAAGSAGTGGSGSGGSGVAASAAGCGRMMLALCAAYVQVAQTGRLTPAMAALLANSSPARVADHISAPTLLVQGENDTLFGLDQADANARAIAANGAPVAVSWYPGGHNGGGLDAATQDRVTAWLEHYLMRTGPAPSDAFRYSVSGPPTDSGRVRTRTLELPGYPGLPGRRATTTVTDHLAGAAQTILNPPGGTPAAVSSLPGVSTAASGALGALSALPGQTAVFASAPVTATTVITGSATVQLSVAAVAGAPQGAGPAPGTSGGAASPAAGAVLYLSLAASDAPSPGPDKGSAGGSPTTGDGSGAGSTSSADAPARLGALLPGGPAGGAVAPVRIPTLPADGSPVTVTAHLPAVALQLRPGQVLELRVATTDQGYAGPTAPAAYRVSLADGGALRVPEAGGVRVSASEEPVGLLVGLVALVVVAAAGLVLAGRVRRRPSGPVRAADPAAASEAPPPLEIHGLRKEYPGGVVAVDDVTFRVERGQVLGLLGPNGAGKTTTLRMVMGLILPTAGRISLFGRPARPGAEILSRIGSFVEGSGFLPHLSGRANLRLYWRATGRPDSDAHLDEALAIADLGPAIGRRVKTYSQGMRQRLAIAQAMLGLPDLLLLDEPTNGLDPPQIHAMREVLRRYAATGRTVLISSHLLSEVEQTCTHVVIVNKGRTVAAGSVAQMVSESGEMLLATPDPAAARAALAPIDGLGDVEVTAGGLQVDLGGASLVQVLRAVLDAGVIVTAATPRNRLEDVFMDLVGAGSRVGASLDPTGAEPSRTAAGSARGSAEGSQP